MSFRRTQTALAMLALGAASAGAQYSTPVGTGAAKPKTLRATAVLEWTGSLEKPNASRLMPIAVWDGEHYQPAGLYLARPAPLAFDTGTQYELERSGEPAGLFNVRGAAQLHGEWIGIGKFQPEAAPAPPPKLKASKHLPVLTNGRADSATKSSAGDADTSKNDRPTLHRKPDDSSSPPSGPQTSTSAPSGSTSSTSSSTSTKETTPSSTASKPSDTSSSTSDDTTVDSTRPTLHRRTDSSDSSAGASSPSPAGSPGTGTPGTATPTPPATGASTGSSSDSDSDRPTLHRRADTTDTADTSSTTKSPSVDPDRPTLHKQDAAADADPDRPTLHRARSGGDAAASIDPDRPHLRYGASDDSGGAALPARLEGVPSAMQQMVAVSDSATGELRPYQYHWPSPDDAAKMQSALAALAVQAIQKPAPAAAKPVAQFGPAARKARQAHPAVPAVQLVDEHLTTYELSFSAGPTLVYSARTADEGPQRVYITLIAQPDFTGKPQVLLQQVARANRLDEVPAMQLVDALDTDNDQRAELIFQLNGAAQSPVVQSQPSQAATDLAASTATDNATQFAKAAAASAAANAPSATAAIPEREFAIYRVANGKATQVFTTGPLP